MKLVTFRESIEDAAQLGVVRDDMVVAVKCLGVEQGLPFPSSMQELIDLGPRALDALGRYIDEAGDNLPFEASIPLSNVELLAPIPRPRNPIFGVGMNYAEHVKETRKSLGTGPGLPEKPVIFFKLPNSVIGPDAPIHHNAEVTQKLDWEVELAVIMGSTACRVSRDDAMKHVFGYSVLVDITARDNRRGDQWTFAKAQTTHAPFGPFIVTKDEVSDPNNLPLWLKVNGTEKQSSNTSHFIFDIPTLIADISSCMTLEPGDVIATGTPSGVGGGRDPQEFLWPGDVVECGVDGVGTLRNPVIAVGNYSGPQ